MAAPRPKKRALSDRLKNMRFMKRQEETTLREKLLQEQKQREREAHWTTETDAQPKQTTPVVLIEDGVSVDPVDARVGRQSFGKFNTVFETQSELDRLNNGKGGQCNQEGNSKLINEEPPTLADGISREGDSDSDSRALPYRRVNLQGASRAIAKKRKRKPMDRVSRGYPGKLGNHGRNPL